MVGADAPVRVRKCSGKMVVVRGVLLPVVEHAALHDRLAVDRVCAGKVECNWVEGGEHPNVRNERDVVFRVAIAVW